ncbi:MAG: class II aldolase/adducin family protein [Gammaproteobacteria bacterium]
MENLRRELIDTMRAMNARDLNQGKAGNGSFRSEGGFVITPSGVDYQDMNPSDLIEMDMKGEWEHPGRRRPSSEWRFHRDIYRTRPDVNAILHTHGRSVTTLACAGRSIPAFHYMVAVAGGSDIRCAEYATFGTQELSEQVCQALENRKACLLAHHGLVAVGDSLAEALDLVIEVEHLAEVYWRLLSLGEVRTLSDEEMERVLERFRSGYGDSDSTAS